jgi:cobalt-zinc-cadmium efflux system outer membrane protein
MRRIAPIWCAVGSSAALFQFVSDDAFGLPPDRYPLAAALESFEAPPPGGEVAAVSATEPTGELALADALALVLLRNPGLAIDSYEQRAREAALLQAGVRPNPTLVVDVQDFAGTGVRRGVRATQSTITLSQLIELGGKRAARLSLANADAELAAWDYEMRRIELFAHAGDAFVEVLAAQERLRLAEDAHEIARAVESVASRRTEAGFASPAEVLRAGVAVDTASTLREHTEHELETARQALAALWAGTPRFTQAVGDLALLPTPPDSAELLDRIEASPGIARWQSEIARREAAQSLVRSTRTSDVEVSGGPRHFSEGDDLSFVVSVSLPIPLWDRKTGALAEASQRVAKSAAERRAEQVRIATDVKAAQLALVAAVEEAKLLNERVLPGISKTVQILQRGYEEGRFAQVEVLEAERTRVEAREQALRAAVEAHRNAREIERLTGAPLEVRR